MKTKLALCDQIVMEEFKDLMVVDDEGGTRKVGIIWGTDDKAFACYESGFIRLPHLNLYCVGYRPTAGTGFHVDYKLNCSATYMEDMNQIIEQVLVKFNPTLKTSKLGYYLPLKLYRIAHNLGINNEATRIVKSAFDFELTVSFKDLEPKEA